MHVEFEATPDDFVDVQMRAWSRSPVGQAQMRRAKISAVVWIAIALVAALWMILVKRFFGASFMVLAAIVLAYSNARRMTRVRRAVRDSLERQGPMRFSVDLTDNGVSTQTGNRTYAFPWTEVGSIEEKPDSVEIISSTDRLLVVVRNRAFASPEERSQFIEVANSYLLAARQTQPADPQAPQT